MTLAPRVRRRATALLLPALTASLLTGCSLLDGSSRLEEALEYLPAEVTSVRFVDRAAIAERLGVDDLETGADESELDEWAEAASDEPVASELDRSVALMQDAAFSAFDLEWEVTAVGGGLSLTVWKLSDDVDFDAVAKDLRDAGYEEGGSDEAPRFTGSLADLEEPYAQTLLTGVQLVPDERLVITGNDLDAGLEAVQDDADSLADSGTFSGLLDRVEDAGALEYAHVSTEECGAGAFIAGEDDPARVVLLLDSEEEASSDAEDREQHLEEFAEVMGADVEFDVRSDGEAVIVETGFDDRRFVSEAVERAEAPLTCSPSGEPS